MTDFNDDTFGPEFAKLPHHAADRIRAMVRKTAEDGQARAETFGDGDLYTYRHPGGGVAWGANLKPGGLNSHRGIWRPAEESK